MAAPISTLRQWFTVNADPYTGGALLNNYRPEAAVGTPLELLQRAESDAYPLIFVGLEDTGQPLLYVCPTRPEVVLPGAAPSVTYRAYAGDFTSQGGEPTIVAISNDDFRLTGDNITPTDDRMTALFTANPDVYCIDWDQVNAGATVTYNGRPLLAVPHQFCAQMLEANATGTLTARWIWENLVLPIITAGGQGVIDIRLFIDHVKAMACRRSPLAAGGGDRPSKLCRIKEVPVVSDATRDHMKQKFINNFLPGLRANVGVGAQIAQVQANQQQLQQQQLTATREAAERANREKTLKRDKPVKYENAKVLNQSEDETLYGIFWKLAASTRDSEMLSPMLATIDNIARAHGYPSSAADAALLSDILQGRLLPISFGSIKSGSCIFRMFHLHCPDLPGVHMNNKLFTTMQSGTGTVGIDAMQIIVADNSMVLPVKAIYFEPGLQAWHCLLELIMPNSSAVNVVKEQLVDRAPEMQAKILNMYESEQQQALAFILVYTFAQRRLHSFIESCFRASREYYADLALNPPAPGAPVPSYAAALTAVQPLNFDAVHDYIEDATLLQNVALPKDLVKLLQPDNTPGYFPVFPAANVQALQGLLPNMPYAGAPAMQLPPPAYGYSQAPNWQQPPPWQVPYSAPPLMPPPQQQQQQQQQQQMPPAGSSGSQLGGDNSPVHNVTQNLKVKRSWTRKKEEVPEINGVYDAPSPFHDPAARGGKRIVPSDTPNLRICLPMALTGHCYRNCKGKHGVLSATEVQRVAQVGGLTIE